MSDYDTNKSPRGNQEAFEDKGENAADERLNEKDRATRDAHFVAGSCEGLSAVLDDIERVLEREMVMGEAERIATILFIAHVPVYKSFKMTPRLFATSVNENSGKSTLLKRVAEMAPGGEYFNKVTPAYLRRTMCHKANGHFMLVADQLDNAFKHKECAELIDTLCAGADSGARQGLVDRTEDKMQPTEMSFHFPCALGKIGPLPNPALASRCIEIRMHPCTIEEDERLWATAKGRADDPTIPERLAKLLPPHAEWLANNRPDMPKGLANRFRDKWHPLVAVADLASPKWGERARWAAVQLENRDPASVSKAVRLLHRALAIAAQGNGVVFAHELDCGREPPSTLLRQVGVDRAVNMRRPGGGRAEKPMKGWKLEELEAVAKRYPLPKDD
ncbi:DUF3631 domain-containing protein [Ensifer aridi]|uniref:DUF3631 domain-containing protein n=1 Tax=Ensifer aridi TaxID=1708715 RepID=UPI000A0FD34B|nr:DUF3631 domain-containing protein [Ensifer aridi]